MFACWTLLPKSDGASGPESGILLIRLPTEMATNMPWNGGRIADLKRIIQSLTRDLRLNLLIVFTLAVSLSKSASSVASDRWASHEISG